MKNKHNALLRKRKNMPKIDTSLNRKWRISPMAINRNYEIRWQNFKGFEDTGWRKIKPLTIIIGPNNSGKSSFIAPLLLMHQTMTSLDSSTPLVLNGRIYDAGNIRELLTDYNLKKEFSFGLKYFVDDIESKTKKVGEYPPGAFEVTFGIDNPKDRKLILKNETIYDIYFREYLSLHKNRFDNFELKGSIDKSKLSKIEKKAIRESLPLNFLFSPNSLLTTVGYRNRNVSKSLSPSFTELLNVISANFTMARGSLSGISYLGPIREKPKRYYVLKNENNETVGPMGENVVDLMHRNFKKISKDLNYWISQFEFGDTLEMADKFSSISSIIFRKNNVKTYTNMANAGFGASQILPMIVQALVSPANTLTIAEQPEIHLNPRLQGVLAELFKFMIDKDQRVIVETHSEHLILRLRRLIASGDILPENVALYFIEKKKNRSVIEEIKIDSNGRIPNNEWPAGFFGDTLKESFALAAQQAKNKKVTKKK